MTQCAHLPASQRDICEEAASLNGRSSTASAQRSIPADVPSGPSGTWIASEVVDAKFASMFRSAVLSCGGSFQIQLVDELPQ
ncbi:MAG: hypothetical protein ACREX6_07130, partial [Casimicrobiaceae bacterium]